jgi:hypothetical protein
MKKESAAWNVAATHFLTAGFLIPVVTSFIVSFVVNAMGLTAGSLGSQLISRLVWLVSIWFGVMYSARYLARKYVVSDARKITRLSTTYYVVIAIFLIGGFMLLGASNPDIAFDVSGTTITIVTVVIAIVLFYIASTKYIKQDMVTPPTPPEQSPSGM